jgi:hypothetical protein
VDPTLIQLNPGVLYIAPLGTVEPTSLTSAWDAAWTALGYTEDGSDFHYQITVADVNVAEELFPLRIVSTAVKATVKFSLAEITAKNLQAAYNGGAITVVPLAGGVPAHVTFEPPALGTETRVMLGWQSMSGDERYVWRQCFNTGDVAIAHKKVPAKTAIPCDFQLEKPAGAAPFKWWGSAARNPLAA